MATTVVVAGLIFDTVPEPPLATQMLVPSNATPNGPVATVTVAGRQRDRSQRNTAAQLEVIGPAGPIASKVPSHLEEG